MKITFRIDYLTTWEQTICIIGSIPETGNWDESKALPLRPVTNSTWEISMNIDDSISSFEYRYIVKDKNNVVRSEWGQPHFLAVEPNRNFDIIDIWKDEPSQKYLFTSGFSDCFCYHNITNSVRYQTKSIAIQVIEPLVKKEEELILCGSSELLGEWNGEKALRLSPIHKGVWQVEIDALQIHYPVEYKLAIYNKTLGKLTRWEEGDNRYLYPISTSVNIRIEAITFRLEWTEWKAAGVAIPVFALRTENSFGIGEFSDLKKMVDWASATQQSIIQILPINDTTITYSWTDSYPYNAISIYALHPIYLGIQEFPLKNKELYKEYTTRAHKLNELKDVDYDEVIALKSAYITDLFIEEGLATLKKKDYKLFFENNKSWLFSYACFAYLRDKYQTADYSQWNDYKKYSREHLEKLIKSDKSIKLALEKTYYTQYLLHKQLSEVKEYAHRKGVILKGDIPIGISRNSVEAWVEPHLFNLDTQTGAPPDDFSINGQNWGFPTYNWEEMAKDGYQWWIKRFRKMTDYFDAYRIDHILGFFRIWEIPLSSVQGLLGYFNPALPLSIEEIENWGLPFDEELMSKPYIRKSFLGKIFGEYTQEVIKDYLNSNDNSKYELKSRYSTQIKIKEAFSGKSDNKSLKIRDGLYALCNEVLFVKDKKHPDKYHPRITAQYTYRFAEFSEDKKNAFNHMYDNYYYHRHTDFWRNEAIKKLPALISSTDMLVCGEDLGMIPDSVPAVMRELQILSLEIQRMPKTFGLMFEDMSQIPYTSVCTTSTHDMPPIRAWWEENRDNSQIYYNEVLHKDGIAPNDCTISICEQIVASHLYSPSMLAILPLQDWMSIDESIRREKPEEEQINIPAIANHYWKYRMHITIEELIKADELNNKISEFVKGSGRG